MKKNIEIILDTTPSGGCGCNCGCSGSTIVDDLRGLAEDLKEYKFDGEVNVDLLAVSDFERATLIQKLNNLLDKTNASFRIDEENLEEAVANMLPLVVLDGEILTAYGVPSFDDVVLEVQNSFN